MKFKYTILSTLILGSGLAQAQTRLPGAVKAQDRAMLNKQANDFYKIVDPISAKFSPNTVVIKSDAEAGNKTIAMGTVTEKGIITKYSEINKPDLNPRIVDSKGKAHELKVIKVNKEFDLVLLENPGNIPALKLEKRKAPRVGSFVIAAGAAKESISMGVVSVKPRSLIASDRGFLGVVMDMKITDNGGIKLTKIEDLSAASKAGLQAGDIITHVNNNPVTSMLEMRNFLQKQKPGTVIILNYLRDGKKVENVKVTLGERPGNTNVKRSRLNSMKRMGGRINKVAEGFPEVVQTDMQINSNYCGAPVLDLDGKFVGIVLSRSSRMKSYIITVDRLLNIF